MEPLMITVLLGDGWNETKEFRIKATHGMLLYSVTTYAALLTQLREVLHIDEGVSELHISYLIDSSFTPTIIESDTSLAFYLQLKGMEKDKIGKYPMCVQVKGTGMQSEENVGVMLCADDSSSVRIEPECEKMSMISDAQPLFTENVCNGSAPPELLGSTLKMSIISDAQPLCTENVCNGSAPPELLGSTLRIGANYPSKEYFKETLQMYAIEKKFQFVTKTSHPNVLHVVCIDHPACKWAVRGVKLKETDCFEVRRFDDIHTCSIDHRLSGTRQASAALIGKLVKHEYLNASGKPYQPKSIMSELERKLGVKMNYKKAWRGKECALRWEIGETGVPGCIKKTISAKINNVRVEKEIGSEDELQKNMEGGGVCAPSANGEIVSKQKCGRCRQYGHNQKTCNKPLPL
ncbi:unnamed protein product [Cuscuta epithymum]|uniref:Transposase MuDR plant domain-containing protein n=1 Tax=Cuscuta epithymum TaxID=186058 RepID=A0AAV0FH93_9ASTE|nr:unnamed protein product [Cuscuta epithymum]CAH9134841.1 unnamed protein product [Cuscuta epithymum]